MLRNIHDSLPDPPGTVSRSVIRGDFQYWHYGCDGFDDRGWGCGYRTLQTLCSWISVQKDAGVNPPQVPSIPDIQNILINIGDKEKHFKDSREWIGSVEVCLVIDTLFNIPSKILHVTTGKELNDNFFKIQQHFEHFGSPIMMGGDIDASSKGILGTCSTEDANFLLVVDPHFWGKTSSANRIIADQWILWKKMEDFSHGSFYNLCMPQIVAK